LRHGTLLLGSRVRLRGGTFLRRRVFLLRCPYRRNWPLLGCRPCRSCLRDRPLCLSPIDRGPGSLHWDRSRLTPFHGKRPGFHDRLRLAAVYGNELGAVGARGNPLLLLNC
jgi:hypothetical protein